ncbi:hypothetical protein ACFL5O_11665, partial [Myxococcota bacterium]
PQGQALVNERYPYANDRNRLLSELAGRYFVLAPARIQCSQASKWRNNHCATEVSAALAGSPPASVQYLGTELDWLQFYWGLTRGPDAWTPTQFLAVQRAACAQRICSDDETWSVECEPQRCTGGNDITMEAWRLYEELAAAGRPETVPLTPQQWFELDRKGDTYGVSTVTVP